MKVRIEWTENRRMAATIEAESVAAVEAAWADRYDSDLVDDIEDFGEEIDGGILWESVEIRALPTGSVDPVWERIRRQNAARDLYQRAVVHFRNRPGLQRWAAQAYKARLQRVSREFP